LEGTRKRGGITREEVAQDGIDFEQPKTYHVDMSETIENPAAVLEMAVIDSSPMKMVGDLIG
jgi:hypothetical protein